MKSVGDFDIGEVLQDGALHSQFVQIRVKERDDSFGEGRGAVEIHGGESLDEEYGREWEVSSYLWSTRVFLCMNNLNLNV